MLSEVVAFREAGRRYSCIERNAFRAVKAIEATLLALHCDGRRRVTLDSVVAAMRPTAPTCS